MPIQSRSGRSQFATARRRTQDLSGNGSSSSPKLSAGLGDARRYARVDAACEIPRARYYSGFHRGRSPRRGASRRVASRRDAARCGVARPGAALAQGLQAGVEHRREGWFGGREGRRRRRRRQGLEGVVDRGGRTPGTAAQPAAPSKAPAPLEPAKPDDGDDAAAVAYQRRAYVHAVARRRCYSVLSVRVDRIDVYAAAIFVDAVSARLHPSVALRRRAYRQLTRDLRASQGRRRASRRRRLAGSSCGTVAWSCAPRVDSVTSMTTRNGDARRHGRICDVNLEDDRCAASDWKG